MAEYVTEFDGWINRLPVQAFVKVCDAMVTRKRERVTRCNRCRWAHEAPPVEEWHLECRVHPLNMHYTPDAGFCHLGEPREDE